MKWTPVRKTVVVSYGGRRIRKESVLHTENIITPPGHPDKEV
jgi:hypothetical protein